MAYLPFKQPHRNYHRKYKWVPQSREKIARQKAAKLFYNRKKWVTISQRERLNNPVCEVCEDKPSAVCDHIIRLEVKDDGTPKTNAGSAYDSRNHMAMCDRCHNIKRGLEVKGFSVDKTKTPYGYIPKHRDDIKHTIRKRIK